MAKITMDVSEYETMKENKRLLEKSLETERKLQDEIKKLNSEKISALEDAKMKVVKITRTEETEHILTRKDDETTLRELCRILKIDRWCIDHVYNFSARSFFEDVFFDKIKTSTGKHEEVTTHGLDDIKAEIRTELKSKMDEETTSKLQEYESLKKKYSDLYTQNKDLKAGIENLTVGNTKLTEKCDELTGKLKEMEDIENRFYRIKTTLDGCTFWNKSRILGIIRDI